MFAPRLVNDLIGAIKSEVDAPAKDGMAPVAGLGRRCY